MNAPLARCARDLLRARIARRMAPKRLVGLAH